MIKHIWIEHLNNVGFDTARDSTDVLVQLDDGELWSASFVTIPFLQRQMQTSREVASGFINMPAVRFTTIETPHVIVDALDQDTIEDTIDNLMTLGVFESVFTLYREDDATYAADQPDETVGRLSRQSLEARESREKRRLPLKQG